jgi:hypothetical protein
MASLLIAGRLIARGRLVLRRLRQRGTGCAPQRGE